MPSTTQDLERKIAWSIRAGTAFPSPAHEGDYVYRTDLNELYIYDGAAWVPWRTRGYTIVVAASNSIDPTLADPAYRCDGTADQAEINNAITALGATGGAVILLEGQYNISGGINLATGTALMGQGAGTVLRIPNGHNVGLNVIAASNVNRVLVKNLRIDGNRANQAAGNMDGINFDAVTDSKIINCWAENLRRYGIQLHAQFSWDNIISGNECYSNETGIYLGTDADHNSIVCNTCASNTSYGIHIDGGYYNTITGNVCSGNSEGIYGLVPYYKTITGNAVYGNTSHGIHMDDIQETTISSNLCHGNGGHGIWIHDAFFVNISGNTVSYNDGDGILIEGGLNDVVGNVVKENSQGTDNTNDGIRVSVAGSDYNSIQTNKVFRGAFAAQQRYGIRIDAGTENLVMNNDVYQGGKTANFSDAGTGTIVRDNRGWVTENNVLSPAFAIDAVAVVTVTIPHGLDVTPAPEDCQLTVVEVTDVDDWAEGYVKVESVGAANVVAKVNVTTASATGGATAKLALHVDLAGG